MRRPALLALVVALSVGACASRAEDASFGLDPTTTTARPDTSPTSDPPAGDGCAAGDLDPDQLEPVMLDDREGFSLQPDSVADTGPSDLAKAIADDEQADAAEVMRELGFRRGYQRYWTDQAGSGQVEFVYEFCEPAGATAYGDRVFDFVPGLEPFEVVGAPGARGMSGTTEGALVAYAFGVHDATLVLTIASGPDGTVLVREVRDRATALLTDQLAALAAA